ncbi:MAG: glycosyltransferase [Alphaproteobacteria bacterium]|nr:glycosyltransferase [Alphaproteobacteria bacterium]
MRHEAVLPQQMEESLDQAMRWHMPLSDVLLSKWWLREEVYRRAVAAFHALPFIRLSQTQIDKQLISAEDVDFYLSHLMLPIERKGERCVIALTDPGPKNLLHARQKWGAAIDFVVTSKHDILAYVQQEFAKQLSHRAVYELAEMDPDMSAQKVLSRGQAIFLYLALTVIIAGLALQPVLTIIVLNALMTFFYLCSCLFKGVLVLAGSVGQLASARAIDAQLRQLRDEDLPTYTILVPMFREPDVLPILVHSLRSLDYPFAKLDIKIILEEGDLETLHAVQARRLEPNFEIIIVPPSQPQTKPKACNYALPFARGEFLVIYDAEDKPEPDQLRKVVAAFHNASPRTACIQCRLNYFNANENWLTRMFTLDYSLWFDLMLPGLQKLQVPVPLGGTSNHFRTHILRQLHAWDPFNVTEDADLGIRLAQRKYEVGVIDSTTFEEANCNARNWVRQRSRWIKGYMQTLLVHSRRPVQLWRTVGPLGTFSLLLFVGGTALSGLLNPLCWGVFVLWMFSSASFVSTFFPSALLFFSLFNLIVGNGLFLYLMMVAPYRRKWTGLSPWALTVMGYWVLMSISAYKALAQLIFNPFYWEKTEHGLSQHTADELARAKGDDHVTGAQADQANVRQAA